MKTSKVSTAKPTKKKDAQLQQQQPVVEYIHVERDMDKESKEMKKAMEKVAKAMFAEREVKLKKEIEEAIRVEVSRVESFFSARISQLEERISYISSKNEENFRILDNRVLQLHTELNKLAESSKSNIEKERQKRLDMIKKLYKSHKEDISSLKEDSNKFKGDFGVVKEHVDDLFLKQFGCLPSEKSSKNGKFEDSGNIVEQLNKRVNRLEITVKENLDDELESGEGASFCSDDSQGSQNNSKRAGKNSSKSKSGAKVIEKSKKSLSKQQNKRDCRPRGRLTMIESTLSDLQLIQSGLEDDIDQMKSKLELILTNETMNKRINGETSSEGCNEVKEECKLLKKRIRELGESTAKACKSLGAGIADLQQSSLGFYAWADRARSSIGVTAEAAGLSSNPCPALTLQGLVEARL